MSDAAPNASQIAPCRICSGSEWSILYRGRIRMGGFGALSDGPREVWHCGRCGAGWLAGAPVEYASEEYRTLVDGGADAETFYKLHDREQAAKLRIVGSDRLRGAVVADFGCGAGAFLDLIHGMAAATIAIDPAVPFHAELRRKGHHVFSTGAEMDPRWLGQVDLAVCFSVIEHVDDPVGLLREIHTALKPGGRALISTPNRRDWLLELLPEEYGAFFYRHVHRWYFDAESLKQVSARAGFDRVRLWHVHRFDLSNLLLWLRDRRPSGSGGVEVAPPVNAAFTASLEQNGRADYLYGWLER